MRAIRSGRRQLEGAVACLRPDARLVAPIRRMNVCAASAELKRSLSPKAETDNRVLPRRCSLAPLDIGAGPIGDVPICHADEGTQPEHRPQWNRPATSALLIGSIPSSARVQSACPRGAARVPIRQCYSGPEYNRPLTIPAIKFASTRHEASGVGSPITSKTKLSRSPHPRHS